MNERDEHPVSESVIVPEPIAPTGSVSAEPGESVGREKPVPPEPRAPYYVYSPPLNVLAVVSLILGILFAPAGIVTGHIALRQIKRTGERGRGVAMAGTIIGYLMFGFVLLIVALSIFASSLLFTILGSFVSAFS